MSGIAWSYSPSGQVGTYAATSSSPPLLQIQSDADGCVSPAEATDLFSQLQGGLGAKWFLTLLGAAHLAPYEGVAPWAPVVDAVTTRFFELELDWRPGRARRRPSRRPGRYRAPVRFRPRSTRRRSRKCRPSRAADGFDMSGGPEVRVAYLDNAATTPVRAEVLEAMMPWLTSGYGNASGAHVMARAARVVPSTTPAYVLAEALGGEPGEVVFTGGGTEADNLAVAGAVSAAREGGNEYPLVACSAVEHPAVLEPVRAAGGVVLPVDEFGVLHPQAAREGPSERAGELAELSVMLVNNETGVLQPVESVVELTRELAPEALVHTDAVQALGWLEVGAMCAGADFVSVSADKIGGPRALARSWSARLPAADSGRCFEAARRNENFAPGLTTSPASSPWRAPPAWR